MTTVTPVRELKRYLAELYNNRIITDTELERFDKRLKKESK